MYYYILDPSGLSLEKFERLQIALQGLLAEFKISGELARVTTLRSIKDLVEVASNRGVKTLVACGTDNTFNTMLASLRGRDFTLGYVPFDDNSYLAKTLGIDSLLTAVKTVAARRLERIDLASFNQTFFISYLEFGITSNQLKNLGWLDSAKVLSASPHKLVIRIDGSYSMEIRCLGGLIANTRSNSCPKQTIANPTDGKLDLLIIEKLSKVDLLKYKNQIAEGCLEEVPKTTVISAKKVELLEPRGLPLSMYGRTVVKLPVEINVYPKRLRMIVGKNRTF